MSLDKRNISISFGQTLDTKTDPNQVVPGKLLKLFNATLEETLALKKRYGNQLIASFPAPIASSSLTNAKLGVFNNQLVTLDGKTVSALGATQTFIDNFTSAQPYVSLIQREATPIINQDVAFNVNSTNYAYCWSSSCVAPNLQQLAFSSATGKFQINSQNGTVLASTGIFGFVKNKVFSFANNFIWTGINYATSALAYYKVNASASSTNFLQVSVGIVGGDFPANTSQFGSNRYQRYDGVVLNDNLYLGWFNPATSALNISILTNAGVTATTGLNVDASGALGIFGDKDAVWVAYHNGATSAGFACVSSTSLKILTPPSPWFTTDAPSSTNIVSMPQAFTGTANGLAANIYTQFLNYYPPLMAPGVLPWPTAQRTDFITRQAVNGVLAATSGSSSVVIRGQGFASRAFNYLGNDYFLSAYGGTQTSTSADRLEPTYFLLSGNKTSNNIVSKLAFQNGAGYDFTTGGQSNYLVNNFGSVGYNVPLSNFASDPANPSRYTVPYLVKTAAIPLSSTSIVEPFFISYNFGLNSSQFDFNATSLNANVAFGNNLNIAGGYLASFDGRNITEQNFHLFPEDVRLIGSSSFGPPANTYAYQVVYESSDAQGNIFRSAPSKVYSITTAGSSAMYLSIPTLRATNRKDVVIRVYRNAPTIDTLTFHDIAPLNPAINNPNIDNVVVVDSALDSAIIGNPVIYTTGGVIENTGAPAPTWISVYKKRVMMTDGENRNTIWYSNEVIPGTSVEMSDLRSFFVNSNYGDITCHLEMNDKFIIFTCNENVGAIYYMTGDGPDILGSQNDFSNPNLITTTVSTLNPNSVILTPDGIMFQSDFGIWVLGQNLDANYIGAPVEAFNGDTVTSATLIPNTTQVRFTLNSGVCLVWDYFSRQWSVFSNINATHGVIYQGLFTYLNQRAQSSQILQETPGTYSDINTPYFISLQTSWLSMAGLQGFQRAYRMYLMSRYKSQHQLAVSIAYDFNQSPEQTAIVSPIANDNPNYGSDPFWGSMAKWGGESQFEQNRINFTRQKCQSIQISIQETLNPSNIVYGPGLVLENIGILIGGKLSYPKLPPNLSVK